MAAGDHDGAGGTEGRYLNAMEESGNGRDWHLEKRVSVALIIAIVTQTLGIVWWAATLSARVDGIQGRIAEMTGYASRLARLEERQLAVTGRLDRIEELQRRIDAKIDRLLMNRGKKP